MGNVSTIFVRLESTTAKNGDKEIRLLSPGVVGTDFRGDLEIPGTVLNPGDTIRISAWGTYTAPGPNGATLRVRLYFPAAIPLNQNNRLADTQNTPIIGTDFEWHFLAQITIRAIGANGRGWCDSYLHNVQQPVAQLPFNRMAGLGSFGIDTNVANNLDLTAIVPAGAGSFTLNQCSIEFLDRP